MVVVQSVIEAFMGTQQLKKMNKNPSPLDFESMNHIKNKEEGHKHRFPFLRVDVLLFHRIHKEWWYGGFFNKNGVVHETHVENYQY